MNWDLLKGQWKQMSGKIKAKWGKFTDNELDQLAGQKDQLVGKLQEKYGYEKSRAEREVDDFCRTCQTP